MNAIITDNAPGAVGPYSQAQRYGSFLFCSGQLGIDPRTGKLAGDDISTQTQQIFKNIKAILAAADLNLNNIVKTTIFIKNMDDFPVVNNIYASEFGNHKPARSTIEVSRLPINAVIMIECIAVYEEQSM